MFSGDWKNHEARVRRDIRALSHRRPLRSGRPERLRDARRGGDGAGREPPTSFLLRTRIDVQLGPGRQRDGPPGAGRNLRGRHSPHDAAMRMQAYRTNPDGTPPFGGFLQQQRQREPDAWNTAGEEGRTARPPAVQGGPGAADPAAGERRDPPAAAAAAPAAPPDRPRRRTGWTSRPVARWTWWSARWRRTRRRWRWGGAGSGGHSSAGSDSGRSARANLVTPPGFIQAARSDNATVTTKGGNKIVEFTCPTGRSSAVSSTGRTS